MKAWLALAVLALSAPAVAEIRPVPGLGDPRIQTVQYDPDQVIQLQVASGYQLTLEFGTDERIENVAIGDSGAWQVTANKRGDHLFIKTGQGGTPTNMIVVTDARTYNFELAPAFGGASAQAFTVRFRYPQAPAKEVAATTRESEAEIGRYHISGSRMIDPSAINDDGVHTYIQWDANQAMPAVFMIDARGQETLVNGMVREDRFVIDSVANKLVFRLGREIAYASRRPKLAIH